MGAGRKTGQAAGRTAAGSEHQLMIVLDRRVALEALLVNALEKSPTARRQEWLRRVLIQGFRAECQSLRALMTDNPGVATDLPRLQGAIVSHHKTGEAKPSAPQPEAVMANHDPAAKPLAQLRTTIG